MDATLVAIAIVEHASQVLVGRRPPGVPLAGLWEFPGGKVRPGETPADAARRECREETGLAVEVLKLERIVSHQYPHGVVQLHFFRCQALDASPPRAPFCWIARSELSRLEFPPANAEVIASLA